MQILVNSDHHIVGSEELARRIEETVTRAVGHFSERITRIEVHVGDVNSHKLGERDKRCLMEARLSGLKPIAVSHRAATLPEAIGGAAEKLERTLDRTLGRLGETPGPAPRDEEVASLETLERIEGPDSRRE